MELQLRPRAPRFHPLMRNLAVRRAGLRGLGLDPSAINPTTIWTPQTGYLSTPGDASTGQQPAVYQTPNYAPVPACSQDKRPGGAAFSAECIAQVLAAQQANMAANNQANRAVDVANCNSAWEQNAARYRELGMAVPPNDCAYRGYGLTQPGTTGGYTGYMPGTPQEIIDWRAANPGGGSPGPAAGGSSVGYAGTPQFSFTNLTRGDNSNFLVGDRWSIVITGAAPNSPVSVNGGKDGSNAVTSMGSTDASGRFQTNGQMSQAEVGIWSEAWRVNNQIVASITFRVSPTGSVVGGGTGTGGGQSTQTPPTTSVFGTLPGGSIEIGGMDIPWVALAGGAVVLFLLMRGK